MGYSVRQPMIETVVSPTASQDTIAKALSTAAAPDPQMANRYATASAVANAGGNPSNVAWQPANTLQANTAPTAAPMAAPTVAPLGNDRTALTLEQMGAPIVGGYVIDPSTGMAVGRATGIGTGTGTGTGTTAPAPTEPGNTPGSDTGAGGSTSLGQVSREAIDAKINALTAQYGLDLASIAALGGEIGAQARFLMAQLQRDQGYAGEDLDTNLVSRGIYRSGIAAQDKARLEGDFAAQRAQVEMDKGSRLRQLAERAGAANASLGRGKADAIAQIDAGNLNAELRQTLLNELNSLTSDDINKALQAAYSGNQQSLTQLMQQGGGTAGTTFNTAPLAGGGVGDPMLQPSGMNAAAAMGSYTTNPERLVVGDMAAPQPSPYIPKIGDGQFFDPNLGIPQGDRTMDPALLEQLLKYQQFGGGTVMYNDTNTLTRGGVSGV